MDLVVRPVIMRDAHVCVLNGGVLLFGHTIQLRVFVDPDLLQYDEVWAAAGTWKDVSSIAPSDLVRASDAIVTDLKRN